MKNTNITLVPLGTTQQIKSQVIEALCILREALRNRDTEDAHNILFDGSYDDDEDEMEQEVNDYLVQLNNLISQP